MRVTLIVNPHSGRGAAARCAGTVASTLRAVVPELAATVTADAAATSRLPAQAAQRGDDVLAVLGGDGTAHLAAQAIAGSGTALAVLTSGSGNDLAAALGIPTDPVAAAQHVAEALRGSHRRRIRPRKRRRRGLLHHSALHRLRCRGELPGQRDALARRATPV